MAENNNRMVVYLSIAVVLLLVAFVVVVVVVTGLKTAPPSTTAGNTPSTTSTVTNQPGMSSSTSGFDAATATKVPAESDPKKFVTSYYQAILDKKWDVAFKMQPAKSQVGQSVEAFQQTQEQMYGMTSFEIASSQIGSTEATVVVAQTLREPNGVWTAVWTFVNDKGTWLVQARKVNMGAPTATP
jgi:cell division protein FtsN